MAGDQVTSIDGIPTARVDSWGLEMLVENHPPGTSFKLGYAHGAQAREVTLTTVATVP